MRKVCANTSKDFPGDSDGEEPAFQLRRLWLDPWVGKICWRRAGKPTPVFLPGEIPGTGEPGGATAQGDLKDSDTTERWTAIVAVDGVRGQRALRCILGCWGIPCWPSFLSSQWLTTLTVLSCTHSPSICLLWWTISSHQLPFLFLSQNGVISVRVVIPGVKLSSVPRVANSSRPCLAFSLP